ncbi:MAG: ATP-binding protein [Candidatus Parcubacteria bacterium]|nr:ATP-binding protein [Candidatus Parcubacteria bacterium]
MQISLIEFSVENFSVFKEKATLSMVARKNDNHTFESNGENLLKTSFIYGPNASGKTSLLDAFVNLKTGILFSSNMKENSELPYNPFLASENTKTKPVWFELVFSALGDHAGIYRYSFSFLPDHIVTENFTKISITGVEEQLISRTGQDIILSGWGDDVQILRDKARKETLFLSVAAQFNNKLALSFVEALKNVNIISGVTYATYQQFTIKKFKDDPLYKESILKYLKTADFCISGGRTKEIDIPSLENVKDEPDMFSAVKRMIKHTALFFEHPVFGKNNEPVGVFELSLEEESTGTQNFLSMLGPIINTLETGKVLAIDEFDNSLHPLLTKFIVDLFESSETNKHNAQLVVTTHDTSLLSYRDDFIKDQFWFTDKDEFGSARLFSLAEFDIRNDTEFAKKYLEGRFGALPFIGSVKK